MPDSYGYPLCSSPFVRCEIAQASPIVRKTNVTPAKANPTTYQSWVTRSSVSGASRTWTIALEFDHTWACPCATTSTTAVLILAALSCSAVRSQASQGGQVGARRESPSEHEDAIAAHAP